MDVNGVFPLLFSIAEQLVSNSKSKIKRSLAKVKYITKYNYILQRDKKLCTTTTVSILCQGQYIMSTGILFKLPYNHTIIIVKLKLYHIV